MEEKVLDLEYNSQREDLVIPEYGRHVQKLISHAKTIENEQEQAAFIESIVDLMMQIHPQSRSVEDYREKLWKHIYRIANYELHATPPSGVKPKPEDAEKKPEPIGYPYFEAQYRHYGHNVQKLIQKALSMPEGPKREGFIDVIGSYMKLAYRTWNKEHYVSDDIIKDDLESLSGGKLTLHDDPSFDSLTAARRRKQQQRDQRDQRDSRSNNGGGRHRGGGRGGRRKR